MKIFISWSGGRSHAVAVALGSFIGRMNHSLKPWISSHGVEAGSLWFSEVLTQLHDSVAGIVVVTPENRAKPWLLFEAGALARELTSTRVCTVLVGLKPQDVENPLAQFNHTSLDRESVTKLVKMLNRINVENAVDDSILDDSFDAFWPKLEAAFSSAIQHVDGGARAPRMLDAILGDLVEHSKGVASRLERLERSLALMLSDAQLSENPTRVQAGANAEQFASAVRMIQAGDDLDAVVDTVPELTNYQRMKLSFLRQERLLRRT